MTIPVGGEIGQVRLVTMRIYALYQVLTALFALQEVHTVDQHLTFHSGVADAIVNGKTVSARILSILRGRKTCGVTNAPCRNVLAQATSSSSPRALSTT